MKTQKEKDQRKEGLSRRSGRPQRMEWDRRIGQEAASPISISTPDSSSLEGCLKILVPKGNASPDSIVKKPSTPEDCAESDSTYQISAIDLVSSQKLSISDPSLMITGGSGGESCKIARTSSQSSISSVDSESKKKANANTNANQILLDHLQRFVM